MRPIDPDSELPTIPGDPVNEEIREAEQIGKKELLRRAWEDALWAGWSIHVPKRSEGERVNRKEKGCVVKI